MKSFLKGAVASLAATALLSAMGSPAMADEARAARAKMYLKIADIPGESNAANHQGEIEIYSWSLGATQTGTGGGGGGGGSGKVELTDLTVSKLTDAASPLLFKSVATGTHHRDAVFTQETAGRNPKPVITIELQDVLISSYQAGGTAADVTPTEQVSLNFAKITMKTYPKNGGPAVVFCWQKSGAAC